MDAQRIGIELARALDAFRAAVLLGDAEAETQAAAGVAAVVGRELAQKHQAGGFAMSLN